MPVPNTTQFSIFKNCIAQRLLRVSGFDSANDADADAQTASESGPGPDTDSGAGLDDFASYLATEAWPVLPAALQEATYETRETLPDVNTAPLDSISTAVVDSLVSYGVVNDADDALVFLRKTLCDYHEQACAPPPVWSSTRTEECAICMREVPLTYHHLIPRSTHAKVLKKGWHPKAMLNSVAWLCRPCHSVVHHVATNEELARDFHTVELLLQREDVRKWQKYAEKQRFGVRRG